MAVFGYNIVSAFNAPAEQVVPFRGSVHEVQILHCSNFVNGVVGNGPGHAITGSGVKEVGTSLDNRHIHADTLGFLGLGTGFNNGQVGCRSSGGNTDHISGCIGYSVSRDTAVFIQFMHLAAVFIVTF